MIRKIIISALLLMLSSQAHSAVLYDESMSGDLGVIPGAAFALALGSNQVLGSWPGTPPADSDIFNVSLTAGLKIDSISVSYDSLANGEQITTSLRFASANLFDDNFHDYTSGSGHSASFMDTTPAETGALDTTLAGSLWEFALNAGTLFSATSWSVDIVTSQNVTAPPPSAVPVPAALWLFASALIGMVGFGKRRKNS
jgi:hypothetical protein